MFVRATYYRPEKTVHYFEENGEETLYIGGSFAWRTNNPGNLARPGKRIISTSIGLAQRTSNVKSLFLIFPDRATGDAERIRLLKEVYGDRTIAQMIERYAPRNENDTDGYIDTVATSTGVESNTVLNDLDEAQFKRLSNAMAKHEGWIPGKIIPLGKPKSVTIQDKLKQPMASQAVKIEGASKPVTMQSDASGILPPIYPNLFADRISLIFSDLHEKIGDISDSAKGSIFTFIAPYFAASGNADVHQSENKPAQKIHIVKSGETLGTIASHHGITIEALVAANRIKDANKIFERQHLRVPAKQAIASPHGATKPPALVTKSPTPPPLPPRHAQKSSGRVPPAITTQHPKPAAVSIDQQRTDKNHPITVVSTSNKEASGSHWCKRFMGDNTLNALSTDFKPKVVQFVAALKEANIGIRISSILRPVKRAYLMYWAFKIAKGTPPEQADPFPGVDIDWLHRDKNGNPDYAKAKTAAQQMCAGYGIRWNSAKQKVARPGRSNHTQGDAIDMTLTNYIGKSVKNAQGEIIKIGAFSDLAAIGRTYGVIYFPKENMHWSINGR